MTETAHTIIVHDDDTGTRLDKCLAARLPELSRSRLQALIAAGYVACRGQTITDASAKVKPGERYLVTVPEAVQSHIAPQDIALDIIYEDEHLLVINKPAGLTVHPAPGHPDSTLVNALLAHCGASLSGIGGVARPGIVHRIDKETSGLLVVAKHDRAHVALSEQLAKRTLKRTYSAVVWGAPSPARGTITGNIGRSFSNRKKMAVVKTGGKTAVTHYKIIASFDLGLKSPVASLVECQLETGRTHQIRVHFAHAGHALVGDPTYGQTARQRLTAGSFKNLPANVRDALLAFNRQALHAEALELVHPATGKKMQFTCAPPADMQALITPLSS